MVRAGELLLYFLRNNFAGRHLFSRAALAVVFLLPIAAFSATNERHSAPLARRIIAVYDGFSEPSPPDTRIHRWAEFPLNHLGFFLSYHDVRDPLPEIAEDSEVAGILTWFSQPLQYPVGYFSWATKAARSGKKIAILGEVGGRSDKTADMAEMNALLNELGLHSRGRSVSLTFDTAVLANELKFEVGLGGVVPTYPLLDTISSAIQPLLVLKPPLREGGGTSTVAAISPLGGFVSRDFEVLYEPSISQARWRIDPFRFFSRALGVEVTPRPDLTTTSGRRNFFARMDIGGSDGVAEDPGAGASLLKNFDDEISAGRVKTPVSITAPVSETARRFVPKWFDMSATSRLETGRTLLLGLTNSTATQGGFFRKARVAMSHHLIAAPGPHPAQGLGSLFIWPRGEVPSQSEVAALRGKRMVAMQESSNRFDPLHPSITNLAPIARPLGQERLLYSINGGEDLFSPQGRSRAAILKALETTQRNMGNVRRLAGIDYHFHLQSLRSSVGVQVVKSALAAAAEGPFFLTTVEHFAQMADSFFDIQITKLGELSWRIDKRGAIHTLRLDDAVHLQVDMSASKGVLGQQRHDEALYIALDAAETIATVSLKRASIEKPVQISLIESRWRMSDLDRSQCNWTYVTSGFGAGDFVFEGLPEGDFLVSGVRDGTLLWSVSATTEESGRLVFQLPADGFSPIQVTIQCLERRR